MAKRKQNAHQTPTFDINERDDGAKRRTQNERCLVQKLLPAASFAVEVTKRIDSSTSPLLPSTILGDNSAG
jgi:hypothetical protein